MIGSKEMAELEQKKCSNIPLLLKAVKITVVTMWRCRFSSLKITTVCLISLSVWGMPLWWWDEPSRLLCGQPEDFEGVEGGGKSDLMIRINLWCLNVDGDDDDEGDGKVDLLRGLVEVGRYHLHRHRKRARLVPLEKKKYKKYSQKDPTSKLKV